VQRSAERHFAAQRIGHHPGDEVFARHAAAHDVKIPERSYLRAALQQREADIMASFHGAIAPELLAAE